VVTVAAGVSIASLAWIGWVLTFAGLVTGYIYFRSNRKIKRIEWWVDSDQDLINFPGSVIAEDISVAIDGDPLKHPRAVQLTIMNSGNVGLRTETMHKKFEVVCEGEQELCSAYVTRTIGKQGRAEELPYLLAVRGHSLDVPSTLLNPGDYVTCQLLIDGPKHEMSVLGEAEDFEIKHRPSRDASEWRLTTFDRFSLNAAVIGFALIGFMASLLSVVEEVLGC